MPAFEGETVAAPAPRQHVRSHAKQKSFFDRVVAQIRREKKAREERREQREHKGARPAKGKPDVRKAGKPAGKSAKPARPSGKNNR